MKALSLLALAAIAVAGVAQAQTYGTAGTAGQAPAAQPMQPSGQMQTMPSGQGQAVQSGQMQPGGQMQSRGMMNQPMQSQAMTPTGPDGTFKDEYGFRYNSRGDRIDARGRILPPPVTPPGARALK